MSYVETVAYPLYHNLTLSKQNRKSMYNIPLLKPATPSPPTMDAFVASFPSFFSSRRERKREREKERERERKRERERYTQENNRGLIGVYRVKCRC